MRIALVLLLAISCVPAQDTPCTALPLVAGTTIGDTSILTSSGVPVPCGSSAGSNDEWYVFTALGGGTVTCNTCVSPAYDTTLSSFVGACAALVNQDCNDDFCGLQSQIVIACTVGTTYWVRVGGFSTNAGPYTLTVSESGGVLVPLIPEWELNGPDASIDFDGVQQTNPSAATAATTPYATGAPFSLNLGSTNTGVYDIAVQTGAGVPANGGGFTLPASGQIINLNLAAPITWLSTGTATPAPFPWPGGSATLSGNMPNTPASLTAQAFWTDPANPDGLALSQDCNVIVAAVSTPPTCMPGPAATPVILGDDAFVNIPFSSATFFFYGVAYTDLFIGSNGFITFGGGDNDFTQTEPEMLGGLPRISMYWDDLSPNNGGTVGYTETTYSITVDFSGVPEYPNTGANTFCAILDFASGNIGLTHDAGMTSADAIVGISPGFSIGLANNVDLSVGPNIGAGPSGPIYEIFNAANPNDLPGTFHGYGSTGGAGPYTQN
ncbi:MAG: hypothetical protein CMJ83_21485 [Planctomycetes bacterium]|nr:hypothetical protein [Planctomycetota bacterium]